MPKPRVTQNIPGVKVTPTRDTSSYDRALERSHPDPVQLEADVRALAKRFNVDPALSPRDRCLAITRRIAAAGGVGGGFRRSRVPGEDDV